MTPILSVFDPYSLRNAINASDPMGTDLEIVSQPQYIFHGVYGVTDDGTGNIQWYGFGPVPGHRPHGNETVAGTWTSSPSREFGITLYDIPLTPAQDLVLRSAFDNAAASMTPPDYNFCDNNCYQQANKIVEGAIGGPDQYIDPVNHATGDITGLNGISVGWEDLNTGNIYDSRGNWAGWDPNFNSSPSPGASNDDSGSNGRPGGSGRGGPGNLSSLGYGGPISSTDAGGHTVEGYVWELGSHIPIKTGH